MELILPKPLDQRLSQKEAALHLAIGLFVSGEATIGQAAETAGLSQADFLKELGRRQIPIHYGAEELASDLEVVEVLVRQRLLELAAQTEDVALCNQTALEGALLLDSLEAEDATR